MLLILPNQYKVPKSISSSLPLISSHLTLGGVKYAKYFSHVNRFISLYSAAKKSLGMMQIDLTSTTTAASVVIIYTRTSKHFNATSLAKLTPFDTFFLLTSLLALYVFVTTFRY